MEKGYTKGLPPHLQRANHHMQSWVSCTNSFMPGKCCPKCGVFSETGDPTQEQWFPGSKITNWMRTWVPSQCLNQVSFWPSCWVPLSRSPWNGSVQWTFTGCYWLMVSTYISPMCVHVYIYIIMLHNYICTWVCLKIGYQMIQWFIIIFPKRGMQCTPSSSKPLNPEPGQGVAMTSIQHDTSSSPNGEIHENQVWVPPFSVKPVLSGPIDFPMVRPTWVT